MTVNETMVGMPALRDRRIEAVLFDMDGLLVDTESLAMRGLVSAAEAMGIDAPDSFCHAMIGVPADHCRLLVQERFGPAFPADAYLADAGRRMEAMIEAGLLKLKPGALELLSHLESVGMPKAVATSSSRIKADRHLGSAGIRERFDAVVTRDDVARGKPHPDLFLRAAQAVGVAPDRCLVLEDSYNGVRAARAAGAAVVMVPDLLPPTDEMRAGCAVIAPDLHAVRRLMSAGP
ncbi:HAD family hydrolase [Azospirillum rugosum]|uniref:HAD superfamily hydrolase (TIGR01509 family) n=2 Tax=Azospirillum rugosum TaxID=416170 RepID=A0ABS4STA3_9PROT|nr:HAD family phosphatase [Azospirillum rugosum]MBP2295788.1 HAD superfamily hydrolase (TIGR01509 family) [Azospirillum rugosum]MDQ0529101.1 HAD superfamily hydrolase (TIGR01509 family) [Azospirillum rugosum]